MATMAEDRERYAGRHWTWDKPHAVRMLRALLHDLEAGSDDARLVVFPGVSAAGIDTLWHCTEDGEAYGVGFNNSSQCPPFNC